MKHRGELLEHVAFIGMPTSGKSSIGRRLTEHLNWKRVKRTKWAFVDIDDCIRRDFKVVNLQEVVDSRTHEEFAQIEAQTVVREMHHLSRPTIVATGGSVVNYADAMEAIWVRSYIIHLCAPYEVIEGRVAQNPWRGITYEPGQDLQRLYHKRMPLYEQWADETIDASEKSERDAIAQALAKRIRHRELRRAA